MKRVLTIFGITCLAAGLVAEEKIEFNRDIRPLLSNRCYACHGPDQDERKADLRLDTREGAMMDLGDYKALEPGDAEKSELYYRITLDTDDDDLMPPTGKGSKFNAEELALIKRWIEQDAPYAQHWSYEKPQLPEIPKGKKSDWPENKIDHFVLARLESEGLTPSPKADRYSLGRRVAMDLTGVPPTWDEVKAFADNKSADAYEKFVDAQIAKPTFGERWGRVWLDLARYADSAGYADDPSRTIWKYRDYVIKSLNENKPFDQFTIEQIAGDLLENPTQDQLIATAFHRNTMTNSEGGTNDEEFRNVAVVDRVNTTMAVWMGTTIDCAQCHTHKYDPLTHHEYYQMFDFFNQSEDTDKKDERPFLALWEPEQEKQKVDWSARISELKNILKTPTPALKTEQETWLKKFQKEPEWTALKPIAAEGKSTKLEISKEGSIVAQGKEKAETDTYSITLAVPEKPTTLTALRLEIAPEQTDNFVLSQISARWIPDEKTSPKGQFLRVSLPGKGKMIHLAEVQIYSGGENVALKGTAKQSSTYLDAAAKRAIDGNTDGDYAKGSVSHTGTNDTNPWLEIDLGAEKAIDKITLWNRTDSTSLEQRLAGYEISLLNAKREVIWKQTPKDVPKPSSEFSPSGVRDLSFTVATATHEQEGFPASAVLTAKADKKKGWAIAGGTGKRQELSLITKSPVNVDGGKIVVTLPQTSEHKSHLLTHFSFSVASDSNVLEWAKMPVDIRNTVKRDSGKLTPKEHTILADHFRTIAPSLNSQRTELAKVEKQLAGAKPRTTIPVMRELPADKHRETHVHLRGSYASHGDKVTAGVPAVFHPLEEGVKPDRLALAKWLVDPENPLTARVVANRHWEHIFGIGIVETSEEFGSQGEIPSHPELLDWLAVDLQTNGWDLKRFIKQLVMSSTYQQSSKTNPELEERDPYNRALARGPRVRVTAEMVRDQALAVSGLLSSNMFGPPVNPPQPNMGLKAAFGSATDWKTSMGEDKYRRGLYTTWRRSNPYPSMATFDAPNREICTVRRSRTNTPLQALVTLNDPVYVEAAQALARKITAEGGDSVEEKVTFAIRNAVLREPGDNEIERLSAFYKMALEDYSAIPDEAKKMAEEPLGELPKGANIPEHAAWTVVSNVILNLDEIFMKR